jgi:hypothetical protein
MAHSGISNNTDWRRQDAVIVGKVAQLVSFHSILVNHTLLQSVQARSRSKQLQSYSGNWATIEIMKTLLKNRRSYRKRLGSLDDEQEMMKKEDSEKSDYDGNNNDHDGNNSDNDGNNSDNDGNNGDNDGNNGDNDGMVSDWEDMYMTLRKEIGNDEDDNGEDEDDNGEDEDDNGEDGCEDEAAIINDSGDGDGNGADVNGGDMDEDGNGRKEINGSHGEFGGKDYEGRNGAGMKRKLKAFEDDEPATASKTKRTKTDGSRDHQAATQSTKKTLPKRKSGRKRN